MSFILDALKKSESERQRQTGPALFEVKVAPPRARLPVWAMALIGLLVVNAGIVAWLMLRESPAEAAARERAAAQGVDANGRPYGNNGGVGPNGQPYGNPAGSVGPNGQPYGNNTGGIGPDGQRYGANAGAVGPNGQPYGNSAGGVGPNGQPYGSNTGGIGPDGQRYGANAGAVGPNGQPYGNSAGGVGPNGQPYGNVGGVGPNGQPYGQGVGPNGQPYYNGAGGIGPNGQPYATSPNGQPYTQGYGGYGGQVPSSPQNSIPGQFPGLPSGRGGDPMLSEDEPLPDEINPDDYAPAVEPGPSTPLRQNSTNASHVARGTESGLPSYSEIAGNPGNKLPDLRLDLHVFAAKPEERFVFINMIRLREGDATSDGVRIEAITRDGAVLSYKGSKFTIERD